MAARGLGALLNAVHRGVMGPIVFRAALAPGLLGRGRIGGPGSKVTNQEIMVEIGRRLGRRRRDLGLSLLGVAQRCGVSLQQVHKYEQAQSVVSAPMLFQLSRCLDVPISYFFEGLRNSE
jgi:hypothetical protein